MKQLLLFCFYLLVVFVIPPPLYAQVQAEEAEEWAILYNQEGVIDWDSSQTRSKSHTVKSEKLTDGNPNQQPITGFNSNLSLSKKNNIRLNFRVKKIGSFVQYTTLEVNLSNNETDIIKYDSTSCSKGTSVCETRKDARKRSSVSSCDFNEKKFKIQNINTDQYIYRKSYVTLNQTITLFVNKGEKNSLYQWFFKGISITYPKADPSYTISNITESDLGVYTCKITNQSSPDLVIHRESHELSSWKTDTLNRDINTRQPSKYKKTSQVLKLEENSFKSEAPTNIIRNPRRFSREIDLLINRQLSEYKETFQSSEFRDASIKSESLVDITRNFRFASWKINVLNWEAYTRQPNEYKETFQSSEFRDTSIKSEALVDIIRNSRLASWKIDILNWKVLPISNGNPKAYYCNNEARQTSGLQNTSIKSEGLGNTKH